VCRKDSRLCECFIVSSRILGSRATVAAFDPGPAWLAEPICRCRPGSNAGHAGAWASFRPGAKTARRMSFTGPGSRSRPLTASCRPSQSLPDAPVRLSASVRRPSFRAIVPRHSPRRGPRLGRSCSSRAFFPREQEQDPNPPSHRRNDGDPRRQLSRRGSLAGLESRQTAGPAQRQVASDPTI